MKARRIVKEKRIRVWAYLDESQYKELLLYKLACQEEWKVELSMKELVEEMINGLMDSDTDFTRFKKRNPELVEKVQSGEYEDEQDEDESPKEQDPEPEEEVAEKPEELDTEVAEVLEKDAPEESEAVTEETAAPSEERKESHENWLRRMNIGG